LCGIDDLQAIAKANELCGRYTLDTISTGATIAFAMECMARAFNVREGFSRQDDTLPERLFTPLENRTLQGVGISKPEFEQTMSELYQIKGWNVETTQPTPERLKALGIEWVAELMEKA
jgi:aldehyde:ferredoxin oxidoreductase